MEQPTSLSFSGLEVPISNIMPNQFGPMNPNWTRVQFAVNDQWEGPKKVQDWLKENCPNRWSSYHHLNPKSKTEDIVIMVVRFEDKNDALLFKLRGGHQAWQD